MTGTDPGGILEEIHGRTSVTIFMVESVNESMEVFRQELVVKSL